MSRLLCSCAHPCSGRPLPSPTIGSQIRRVHDSQQGVWRPLVAFTRDESIRVLRNNTIPKTADLGKVEMISFHRRRVMNANELALEWEVRQAAPGRYNLFNVGLEAALVSEGKRLVPGNPDILFSSDQLFAFEQADENSVWGHSIHTCLAKISKPDEDDRVWVVYSSREPEVHLDTAARRENEEWEFNPCGL
ncbi:hypothetical protein B0H11DRAFT_1938015 [Mycena galericulata]|nr:hypothetical protein B0H11DRAFT_1938015 [Mycena galericulata]